MAAEADVLDQRASWEPEEDAEPGTVDTLEADPADVWEQRRAVPDEDDR
jgi:hypothetical protein